MQIIKIRYYNKNAMPTETTISIWQILLNVGSVSGFLALVYTIYQSLRRRPRFKFDFSGTFWTYSPGDPIDLFTYFFRGVLKNQSLDPNSISRIYLIVWKDRSKSDALRYGFGGVKIIDLVKNEEIKLPISFGPKEAKNLEIQCQSPFTGTRDKKLLTELAPIKPGSSFHLNKYNYQLGFEDVNENYFDQQGDLYNSEEMNLRWTLPNYSRDLPNGVYLPFIKHKIKILWSHVRFRWKIFLQWFGLWK